MDEIRVLQTARLKGRPRGADLAPATGLTADEVQVIVERHFAAGHLEPARDRVKLTAQGRARLDVLLADERERIDQEALMSAYHEFEAFNGEFKQLITDWQLIDGSQPNDHSDAEYDNRIVERLTDLHERFRPLLHQITGIASRLAVYPGRFASALHKVRCGDHSWMARPLADSYHTVWFELHEELIGLAGLSRAAEAAAGRAE
ncbi:hypothetical protein HFP15_14965 [Amycolatopsis sp. K13G38]|uniref:MarR family transcriptional regulator n=1 Tax=Amycolatopsis acididurans TaxID=2724524 RepID=A0ABX1J7B7_9PSEU|nr:hypothetical protein [Amycolatopsis acididurans]